MRAHMRVLAHLSWVVPALETDRRGDPARGSRGGEEHRHKQHTAVEKDGVEELVGTAADAVAGDGISCHHTTRPGWACLLRRGLAMCQHTGMPFA